MNNRSMIIGAAAVLVAIAAYFVFVGDEVTTPQPTSTESSQPKTQ